jgi:hypothetical protein
MDIKKKFLDLTSRTYPHGTEHLLFHLVPQNLEMDDFGNLFIKIGESDVMFTSHFDTATSANTSVNHVVEDNIIKTDGKSILGADDKAGVVIMLYMIENNIPGLYYFFLGEEVGCVGSRKVAAKHMTEKLPYINKVISFDRRGTDSVITYQGGSRCASDTFAKALSEEFNKVNPYFKYKPDPTGIYTDSAQFVKIYPECTNISVGYYSEHTTSERQDIDHLIKLAEACLFVDWEKLPVERDILVDDWSYGGGYGGYYSSEFTRGWSGGGGGSVWSYEDEECEISGGIGYSKFGSIPTTKKITFFDEDFNYKSTIIINSKTLDLVSVDLHKDRVHMEEALIYDFLNGKAPNGIELEYETMSWDGLKLTLTYKDKKPSTATREDFRPYLPEISLRKYIYGDLED